MPSKGPGVNLEQKSAQIRHLHKTIGWLECEVKRRERVLRQLIGRIVSEGEDIPDWLVRARTVLIPKSKHRGEQQSVQAHHLSEYCVQAAHGDAGSRTPRAHNRVRLFASGATCVAKREEMLPGCTIGGWHVEL